MNALQALDRQLGMDALLMEQVDVEQALGQMARGANTLSAVLAHIRGIDEFLEQGEQPFAVRAEDVALHDEHVAEAARMTGEERAGVLGVLGMALDQDVGDAVKVLDIEVVGGIILGAQRRLGPM